MKRQAYRAMLWTAGLLLAWCGPALAGAPVVGTPEDVAPKVEKTRLQKWPRAAWCEGAKCWLVAWREGDIGEKETDIWCARVGADGKALDPAGIRLTSAKGIQDRPVVASDGKGFLVAWSDFRNGQDFDVYAARVSGDPSAGSGQGVKVLDADGFLVAGGAHNQCQPTAAFARSTGSGQADGNWLVAWQGFVEKALKHKLYPEGFGGYEVRGARVSTEGKLLDAGGNVLAAKGAQPCLAVDGDGGTWLAFAGYDGNEVSNVGPRHYPCIARIDAARCAASGEARDLGNAVASRFNIREFGGAAIPMSVAFAGGGGGIVSGRGYYGGVTLFRFDKDGKSAGDCVKMNHNEFRHIAAVASLAADGDSVLLVRDWPLPCPAGRKPNLGIWGWVLSTDGKVAEGGETGFPIAVEEGKDRLQNFVCAGPAGAFLVVCAEPRGVEDTKVVARILK